MIKDSKHLEYAYMNSELMIQLNGLADQDYLNTFLELTGDEPQCLRTTHSSMYPLWSGSTEHDQPSSLTHYQWRELYAAWRLAIPLRSWRSTLDFSLKERLSIAQMASHQYRLRLNGNLPSTVRMTCTCARKFSNDSQQVIPNPNCV